MRKKPPGPLCHLSHGPSARAVLAFAGPLNANWGPIPAPFEAANRKRLYAMALRNRIEPAMRREMAAFKHLIAQDYGILCPNSGIKPGENR